MWRWRQRLEFCYHKPNTEATRSWKRQKRIFPPWNFGGSMALSAPWFCTSSLWNCERINLCFFLASQFVENCYRKLIQSIKWSTSRNNNELKVAGIKCFRSLISLLIKPDLTEEGQQVSGEEGRLWSQQNWTGNPALVVLAVWPQASGFAS